MSKSAHLNLFETVLVPSQEWSHEEASWYFVRVSHGHGYWCNRSSWSPVETGDMLVLPPGEAGPFRCSQIAPARLQGFLLCPELLSGVLNLTERRYLETTACTRSGLPRRFSAQHPTALQFAQLCSSAAHESSLGMRLQMLQLVAHVFEPEMPRAQASDSSLLPAGQRLELFINKMSESEILNFSPAEAARRCGCSLRHFSRLFHWRFGISFRAKQTDLRLLKARQLLLESDAKVIHVALESGYRHLGLFNAMFKKKFGLTPSEWRTQTVKKPKPRRHLAATLAVGFCLGGAVGATGAEAPAQPGLCFPVKSYELQGNTLMPPEMIESITKDFTGPQVSLDTIREALSSLQLAYRGRGFVTVAVSLPQQQLTNGVVKVQVVEGRLADISVSGNRYFSSNNILQALPSLRTNVILNSLTFQQDLDRANANRDRQIYPEIGPGPEAGTTSLRLKVKDRIPLHGRVEFNNVAPIGTPDLRFNVSAQYNNLWQAEHQFGMQYSFTPEAFKEENKLPGRFFDQPLIASYSAFYRAPLTWGNNSGTASDPGMNDFGYDEVTRRFRPPVPGEKTEWIVFGSRSDADTGSKVISQTLTPAQMGTPPSGLQISDRVNSHTFTINENLGARILQPLPPVLGLRSSLSVGMDYKRYQSDSLQTEVFQGTYFVPIPGTSNSTAFASDPTTSARRLGSEVSYLPFSLGWQGSRPDRFGATSFSLNQSVNVGGLLSGDKEFVQASGNGRASSTFYVVNAGLTRDQKVGEDISILVGAGGQWANGPLINNEQFALGGSGGPRGYGEGEAYGDTGWKVFFEPRTPLVEIGMVDGTIPMRVRGSIFTDYGERYLLDASSRSQSLQMWGAGLGVSMLIGEHLEARATMAWPLLDTPLTKAGSGRVYFSIAAQF